MGVDDLKICKKRPKFSLKNAAAVALSKRFWWVLGVESVERPRSDEDTVPTVETSGATSGMMSCVELSQVLYIHTWRGTSIGTTAAVFTAEVLITLPIIYPFDV